MMKASQDCYELVRRCEWCSLLPYQDPPGSDSWSIGWGHFCGKTKPEPITQAKADAYLAEDMEWAVGSVNAAVKVPLNQHQFDALVDTYYNNGGKPFRETLGRVLNAGLYDLVPGELMRLIHDLTGKVDQRLVHRRALEVHLFTMPDERSLWQAGGLMGPPQ